MEVSLIRKTSLGLKGTYRNAEHHAKPVIPIVDALVRIVEENQYSIARWKQGHNISLIELPDGRRIQFRPFRTKVELLSEYTDSVVWGIEVLLYVSRKEKVPLLQIRDQMDVAKFAIFFDGFLKCCGNQYCGMVGSENE